MNNKIVMIIGIVLIVISIALSAVSVVMLNSALGQISGDDAMSGEIEDEMVMVPIAQQSIYEMEDSIIAIYQDIVDGEIQGTLNVSVRMGFGVYAEDDDDGVTELITLLGEREGYLKSQISKLLSSKDYTYISQPGIEDLLQQEILEMVRFELDTEYLIQVYFPDGMLTSYR